MCRWESISTPETGVIAGRKELVSINLHKLATSLEEVQVIQRPTRLSDVQPITVTRIDFKTSLEDSPFAGERNR